MPAVLTFAVKHLRGFFILAFVVFIAFSFLYAAGEPGGLSCAGMLDGLALGASFLMTLESPRTLDMSVLAKSLAWMVCFTGWLMIPLLASALISQSLRIIDREKWYIAKFRVLGRRLEIPEEKLNEWVQAAILLKDSTLDQMKEGKSDG